MVGTPIAKFSKYFFFSDFQAVSEFKAIQSEPKDKDIYIVFVFHILFSEGHRKNFIPQ